jgi:predicted acyl esterase
MEPMPAKVIDEDDIDSSETSETFVIDQEPTNPFFQRIEQSSMRDRVIALGIVLIILVGSIGAVVLRDSDDDDDGGYTPVQDRYKEDYDFSSNWSKVLVPGPYRQLATDHPLNATMVMIDVDLPVTEGGAAVDPTNPPKMSLAYFRPDVPEGMQVPVIMEIGPYFLEPSVGTEDVDVPGTWLGTMIMDEILPHGFAFAQASVFGTGSSNHCMDLMGLAEQLGIDAVVTWLAEQPWCNGNVAMIGKSYDGSTPWEAATFGNPALKTIVPISGLIGVRELMWKNGSSETRAGIMHNVVYGSYGTDGNSEDYHNACPDYLTGWAHGTGAVLWGSEITPGAAAYWEERSFLERVLQNYQGSVYIVQGLQDWNVDPHMAVPVINQLQDAGIEAKGLFGQWTHDYPDRQNYHEERTAAQDRGTEAFPYMTRYDWMQDMLEWFTYYLKEEGPKPALHIEVNDNMGGWRIEERYPAGNTEKLELTLGGELSQVSGGTILAGSAYGGTGTSTEIVFETEPFEEELRFGYLPQFHVRVTPSGNGGQIYALLEDSVDGTHLGHAIMDLRYYEGGDEYQNIIPGVPITAKMEFWAMDIVLPAGHGLRLTLLPTGEDYVNSATNYPVQIHTGEDSILRLPLVDQNEKMYFKPPVWYEDSPFYSE